MAEELKLKVGSDTRELEAGMKRAQKQVRTLAKAQGILSEAFLEGKVSADQYTKGMSKLQTRQDRYIKAVQSAAKHTKGYGNAMSANAVPATQEFSRVIQDMPYGIQGVANNIQQLTAQFGYLASKTGGTKQALKAMVGSLAGPAGILLAVSVVTAVLPALIKAFKKTESASDDLKFALEDLNTSYKRQIQLIKDEITEANRLLSLNIARAKAIGEAEEKIVERKKKALADKIKVLRKEEKIVKDQVANIIAEQKRVFPNISDVKEDEVQVYDEASKKITQLTRRQEEINQEIRKTAAERQILIYGEQQRKREELEDKQTEAFKKAEKERTKALADALRERLKANEIFYKKVAKLQEQIRGRTKDAVDFRTEDKTPKSDAGDIAGEDWVTIYDPKPLLEAGDKLAEAALTNGKKLTNSLNQTATLAGQAAQVLSKTMSDAFTGIGEYLGDMLSGQADGINLNGKKVLDAFGRFLGDLGKLAIAYGTFQLAMAIASSGPPNPVSAGIMIAAGIGMVAVGKAISNMNKQAPRASSGNYVGNSGGSTTGFATRSHTATPTSNNANVRFEIEGTTLVGVMNNTNNRNIALGGT